MKNSKIIFILGFTLLTIIQSCKTDSITIYNQEENCSSNLFVRTNEILALLNARNSKKLLLFIDEESYVNIYSQLNFDTVVKSDYRKNKEIFNAILKLHWSILDDKGKTSNNYHRFSYIEMVNRKEKYSFTILKDVIFFFKKENDNWILFYFDNLNSFEKISKPLTENEVLEKLVENKKNQKKIINNLIEENSI